MFEIIKSFKAAMYERTSSPLLGSFIIFWCYFNWKALMILFLSIDGIELRIITIEDNYVDSWYNFWCPALWALGFSLIYPYITIFPYIFSKYANTLKVQFKNWIEKIPTIPVEEFNKLKQEIFKKESEITGLILSKSLREDELQNSNTALTKENTALENFLKKYRTDQSNFNEISNENYDVSKNIIIDILVRIKEHLHDSSSIGLSYLYKNISTDLEKKLFEYEYLSAQREWLESIINRLELNSASNILSETTSLLKNLFQYALRIREIVKYEMKDVELRKVNDATENWDPVKDNLNIILRDWDEFLKSEYVSKDYPKEKSYIEPLKSIERER